MTHIITATPGPSVAVTAAVSRRHRRSAGPRRRPRLGPHHHHDRRPRDGAVGHSPVPQLGSSSATPSQRQRPVRRRSAAAACRPFPRLSGGSARAHCMARTSRAALSPFVGRPRARVCRGRVRHGGSPAALRRHGGLPARAGPLRAQHPDLGRLRGSALRSPGRREPDDGVDRTESLITAALSPSFAQYVRAAAR